MWRIKVGFQGYDDTFYLKEKHSPEEILKIFQDRRELFTPGTEYIHTDLLMVLTKAVLERKLWLHDYNGVHSFPVLIQNEMGWPPSYGEVVIDRFTFSDPPLMGL